MGLHELDHSEEVVRGWDDSWRAPTPRAEVTQTPGDGFVPFDSVRGAAVEAARADIADVFTARDHELAQITMNNRSDQNDL